MIDCQNLLISEKSAVESTIKGKDDNQSDKDYNSPTEDFLSMQDASTSPMSTQCSRDSSCTEMYLSEDSRPESKRTLNVSDNISQPISQKIQTCGQVKSRMELAVTEDYDSLSTYISDEMDQDLVEAESHGLQDILPYTISGARVSESFPSGTQYGQVDLNNSNMNHIGPKYIASNITVVNPPENGKETSTPVVAKGKCDKIMSCKVVFSVAVMINLFLIVLVLNKCNLNSKSNEKRSKNNRTSNATWFVSRNLWGANPLDVKYAFDIRELINSIAITQTNTSSCDSVASCSEIVRQIQRRDIEVMHDLDINYNFLIGGDGNIYEGRGWLAASNKKNLKVAEIRVAFIGDYSRRTGDVLSYEEKIAFDKFIDTGLERYIVDGYLVYLECCHPTRPTFVGYHLFSYYYYAFYPLSCLDYDLFYKTYNMCEYNTTNNQEKPALI